MSISIHPTMSTGQDAEQDTHQHAHVGSEIDGRGDVQRDTRAYVVVLANHKGGVTKTTSAANLGACLAEAGRRVLLIDCDPQANLSEAFGWTEDIPGERLEDLLTHPDAVDRYEPPAALHASFDSPWRDQLRIVPCTDALADLAADLPTTAGEQWQQRLQVVLETLRPRFDFILLDTPPGLGVLSGMAMLAADGLIIPARPADLDVRGAGKVYDLVESSLTNLEILGVLIAAGERRWQITRDATEQMHADQMRVLPVQVPRAIRVASAPRYGAPTVVLEPDSIVSHAYRQLADHLLQELGR